MAFLCVSQQGEFKNTIQNFLGEVHVKKTLFLSSFPIDFFIAFLAVSLHEEPKNTIKIFSKIRPENLKKSQKKVGRYVGFFFLGRPLPSHIYIYRQDFTRIPSVGLPKGQEAGIAPGSPPPAQPRLPTGPKG
jgi:hypothetical protein